MAGGKMIVCDGGNGAGKTTVLAEIERHLSERHIDFVMTREPGGTTIGEKIRNILLSPDGQEMSDITELLLFGAARAQHLKEKIVPALDAGKVVVSDRFDSATVSFQHFARGLSLELVNQVNAIATNGFKPNLTIILDIDSAKGLERVGARGGQLDRLERQRLDFLDRARYGYLEQAKADPQSFAVIDASQPLADVITASISEVDKVLAMSKHYRCK